MATGSESLHFLVPTYRRDSAEIVRAVIWNFPPGICSIPRNSTELRRTAPMTSAESRRYVGTRK